MVEIQNISKAFGSNQVLKELSLEVRDKEIHTVIGQSGVGKSVLMKIIIGLIPPDSGRVVMDGQDITKLNEDELNEKIRVKIGVVYQNGALWDSLTIGENLKLVLKLKKHIKKEDMDSMVKESLEMVELPDLQDKFPEELSGGMKKRISVARAMILKPEYIIYDEPGTGLDPVLTNMVDEMISKLNKEQEITSLVISHNIKSAEKISDRISMIYNGRIINTCDADQLWEQDNEKFNKFINGEKDFQ